MVGVIPRTKMAGSHNFPTCQCEMHPVDGEPTAPHSALLDPFAFLPPPIEFTDDMRLVADRYLAHDIDWHNY